MKTIAHWLFIRGSVILFILFMLNTLGVMSDLYSIFSWWDVMTHMLGGSVIGFYVLTLIAHMSGLKIHSRATLIIGALWCAFVFVGWELYEYMINNAWNGMRFDLVDTVSDIMNDTIGAVAAFVWMKQFGPIK